LAWAEDAGRGWPAYGGALAGGHYTSLTQIDAANVARLQQVWV
jgi:quinoprotein glucose dehydrogenase